MSGELIPSGYTYDQGRIALNNAFSGNTVFQTLVDAATIMWGCDISSNAFVTIAGNRALSITGLTDGACGSLVVKQDAVGGRAISFSATPGTHKVINSGGGSVLLSSSGGTEDILSFIYRNSSATLYWNIGYNYD